MLLPALVQGQFADTGVKKFCCAAITWKREDHAVRVYPGHTVHGSGRVSARHCGV